MSRQVAVGTFPYASFLCETGTSQRAVSGSALVSETISAAAPAGRPRVGGIIGQVAPSPAPGLGKAGIITLVAARTWALWRDNPPTKRRDLWLKFFR